jgi:hypothetical protein
MNYLLQWTISAICSGIYVGVTGGIYHGPNLALRFIKQDLITQIIRISPRMSWLVISASFGVKKVMKNSHPLCINRQKTKVSEAFLQCPLRSQALMEIERKFQWLYLHIFLDPALLYNGTIVNDVRPKKLEIQYGGPRTPPKIPVFQLV